MHNELSVQEHIKQLGILYFALIAGQLLVAVLLFMFAEDRSAQEADGAVGDSTISLVVAFFCLMSIGMSFFLYNKRKEIGRKLTGTTSDKLTHYRSSFLVRAAMIEGANLVALIFYFFIERNMVFLVLFALGIAAFLIIRPTVDRIVEDYQLSASEQSELRNSTI